MLDVWFSLAPSSNVRGSHIMQVMKAFQASFVYS